jgi:molybdate transport system substrate-binding protein
VSVRRLCWIAVVAVGIISNICAAQEITVAAAADLQFAMQDIAGRFQKETGRTVKVTYGSSGNFFQQIQNGGPFDMFFSANLDYAKKLEAAGLVDPGSYYQYASGKIVIWVRNESKLDLSSGMQALLDPSVKKIAIANPEHAPYGQAAVAAMQSGKIYDKLKDKFVLGENISQTASFVVSGSADVGIVALSLALSPNMKDKGRYAEVPADEYPAIEQACVILGSSKNKETARQFLSFVKTAAIADVLRSYGFEVHAGATSRSRFESSRPSEAAAEYEYEEQARDSRSRNPYEAAFDRRNRLGAAASLFHHAGQA